MGLTRLLIGCTVIAAFVSQVIQESPQRVVIWYEYQACVVDLTKYVSVELESYWAIEGSKTRLNVSRETLWSLRLNPAESNEPTSEY